MAHRNGHAPDLDRVRTLADHLLAELRDARAASERRQRDERRLDPMKAVTGHTALDGAIAQTIAIIDTIDHAATPARPAAVIEVGPRRIPVTT